MTTLTFDGGEPRQLLDRLLNAADITQAVQALQPKVLHQLVRHLGLEECGAVLALATAEQLTQVFDADLWSTTPGVEEQFDADRFGLWLEVLVEVGVDVAARKLLAMDFDFVAAAMSRHLLVLDADLIMTEPMAAERAIGSSESYEFGGYTVVAKLSESWDALIAVLTSIEHSDAAYFGRLMQRCSQVATEYIWDNHGLHEVLTADEQIMADVAAAREDRREQQGYVAPVDAAVFLRVARDSPARVQLQGEHMLPAVPSDGVSRIRAHLRAAQECDSAGYARRAEELAYLANVLISGCSFQSRQFTPGEAADAVLAVCNLGLENWGRAVRPDFLIYQSLIPVFQNGWRILYEDVCMYTAARLVDALADLRCSDRAIQSQITDLHRRMKTQVAAGTPWRERENVEVIAIFDTPSWAMLVNLLDECPVVPKNVCTPTETPSLRVPTEFEFIAGNGQLAWARNFAASLAERLV